MNNEEPTSEVSRAYGLDSLERREVTPSEKINRRIQELRIELIELEALSKILASEPIINKIFSGEQGKKFRRFL